MSNCVSINLKRNEIIIKIAEDAEQKKIITELTKKLPDLKKLYRDDMVFYIKSLRVPNICNCEYATKSIIK